MKNANCAFCAICVPAFGGIMVLLPGSCLVYHHLASEEFRAVQRGDSLGGIGIIHLYESDATETLGFAVVDEADGCNRSVLFHDLLQVLFLNPEVKVSNINVHNKKCKINNNDKTLLDSGRIIKG